MRELGLIGASSPSELSLELSQFSSNPSTAPHQSYYSDIFRCLSVYHETVTRFRPQVHRLFGFRTTHGIDDNFNPYSVANLFTPNIDYSYCSETSPNVIATGIILPD